MSSFKSYKESQETVILILYLAMFSSIGLFFVIVETGLIKSLGPSNIAFPIHFIAIAPAVASLIIHYKLKSPTALAKATLAQARSNQEHKSDYSESENRLRFFYPQYLSRLIITLALNESVTILALAGVATGATSMMEFYSNFGVSLILMVVMRPKTQELFSEVEKILAKEAY